MKPVSHALISLEERHAENILMGTKRVELRRRPMNIGPGSKIWIYVKVPIGALAGSATVENVYRLSPTAMWKKFGPVSGLSRAEFYEYFTDTKLGFALELKKAERLKASVSLESLRKLTAGFQPPQFFTDLSRHRRILAAVTRE